MLNSKLVFAVGLAGVVASAEAQELRPFNLLGQESSSEFVCSGENLLEGDVITERIINPALAEMCSGGEVLKIQSSFKSSYLDVCAGSPIPSGWVVTSVDVNSGVCAGAWRLRIVNTAGLGAVRACNGTPIPDGWVVSSIAPSGGVCAYLNFLHLVNSSPPPPPPPPAIPAAPVMHAPAKIGATHIISWIAPTDYPQYRHRYQLERKINEGGWHQVWKGWDNTSWTSGNVGNGSYTYRVRRITGAADGQYSGSVTVVHGGL